MCKVGWCEGIRDLVSNETNSKAGKRTPLAVILGTRDADPGIDNRTTFKWSPKVKVL